MRLRLGDVWRLRCEPLADLFLVVRRETAGYPQLHSGALKDSLRAGLTTVKDLNLQRLRQRETRFQYRQRPTPCGEPSTASSTFNGFLSGLNGCDVKINPNPLLLKTQPRTVVFSCHPRCHIVAADCRTFSQLSPKENARPPESCRILGFVAKNYLRFFVEPRAHWRDRPLPRGAHCHGT